MKLESPVGTPAKSYHLIFSPGFVPQFAFWLATQLLTLHMISQIPEAHRFFHLYVYQELLLNRFLLPTASTLGDSAGLYWLLALLASSCCALQLVLNCFSMGCAGFNTVLGPWRPFFVAMAVSGQVCMWRGIERPDIQLAQAYCATAVTVFITLMPEVLYLWTVRRSEKSERVLLESAMRKTSASTSSVCRGENGPEASSAQRVTTTIHLQVSGMACVACVDTIKRTIGTTVAAAASREQEALSFEHLRTVVELASGKVAVEVAVVTKNKVQKDENISALAARLADALGDIGFPTIVGSSGGEEESAGSLSSSSTIKFSADRGIPHSHDFVLDGSTLFQSVIAGLMGSSCCVLQLSLNLLSTFDIVHIGCAGFNKALGPVRPYVRAMTAGWLGFMWLRYLAMGHGGASGGRETNASDSPVATSHPRRARFLRRLLLSTALSLCLTFLPEALKALPGAPAIAPEFDADTQETLRFVVDNMGCEACEDAVNRILERSLVSGGGGANKFGVIHAGITDFELGEIEIVVAKGWVRANAEESEINRAEMSMPEASAETLSGSSLHSLASWSHLDAELRKHGYELRPYGWVTKTMQAEMDAEEKERARAGVVGRGS